MFRTSIALLSLSFPLPALADLTAQDVWTDWQASATAQGVEISAGEVETRRDGLVLHDLRKTVPGEDGELTAVIDTVTLTQQGDIVAITLSTPITLRGQYDDENATIVTEGTLTFADHEFSAQGPVENISYSFDFADLALSLVAEQTDPLKQEKVTFEVAIETLEGTSRFGDGTSPAQVALTFGTSDLALNGSSEGEPVSIRGHTSSMSVALELTPGDSLPRHYDLETQAQGTEVEFQLPSVTGALSSGQMTSTVTSGPDRVASQGVMEEIDVTIATNLAPFPIAAKIARLESGSSLPFPGSEMAQPIDFLIDLEGLALAPSLWAAFDPAGEIDRTPIALRLDLGAQGAVEEVLNPLAPTEIPQIHPESATLRDLTLTFGGATLAGSGAVDVAPNGTTGLPEPLGTVSFTLDGGIALLEAIGRTGLVGTQQIMGAQMMLGMFAVQEPGLDRMHSEVSFGANRSITVNGVQMR